MTISCNWAFNNRLGFKNEDKTLEELKIMANKAISDLTNVINNKYNHTKIEFFTTRILKWEKTDKEEAHDDIRVSFEISKSGRVGIKEKEVYAEVNKIQTSCFKKIN